MKSINVLLRAAITGTLLLAPLCASAQNPQSETFFAEGRKLRLAGNCTDAIVAFKRSFELNPERIGSLRNIAECERDLKKYASARRSYWNLRRAAMKSADPNYQGWDKDAENAYDQLGAKVPHLTVKLAGRTQGVTVTLDGLLLDASLVGVEVEQDPGAHSIEARYGGVEPVIEKVTLAEGERKSITLRIPEAGAAPPPGSGSKGPLLYSGIAAAAVGGLSLIGMGIAIGERGSALANIEKDCPALKNCDPALAGELDRGRAATTAANVLGAIGIAGLAAGGGLLVAAKLTGNAPAAAQPAQPAKSVSLSFSALPNAAAVRLEGTF